MFAGLPEAWSDPHVGQLQTPFGGTVETGARDHTRYPHDVAGPFSSNGQTDIAAWIAAHADQGYTPVPTGTTPVQKTNAGHVYTQLVSPLFPVIHGPNDNDAGRKGRDVAAGDLLFTQIGNAAYETCAAANGSLNGHFGPGNTTDLSPICSLSELSSSDSGALVSMLESEREYSGMSGGPHAGGDANNNGNKEPLDAAHAGYLLSRCLAVAGFCLSITRDGQRPSSFDDGVDDGALLVNATIGGCGECNAWVGTDDEARPLAGARAYIAAVAKYAGEEIKGMRLAPMTSLVENEVLDTYLDRRVGDAKGGGNDDTATRYNVFASTTHRLVKGPHYETRDLAANEDIIGAFEIGTIVDGAATAYDAPGGRRLDWVGARSHMSTVRLRGLGRWLGIPELAHDLRPPPSS